jgi:hypothetical protein
MKAPLTQEEIDYRADLSNKINAISSIQGLFTDIEDKPRRLRILKALMGGLNYGDAIFAEIDGEIKAIEEAAEEEAIAEAELENGGGETAEAAQTQKEEDAGSEDDIDLGSLDALESFSSHEGDILLEDQTGLDILTEDELPSPAELDSDKDFSENN